MLYIHQLKDLTPKSADIESVFIIRDLKKQTPLPFTEDKIRNYFQLFFVSETEKAHMANALEVLPSAMDDVRGLLNMKDADMEQINLQRALNMISEIPQPLLLNLNYAKNISMWQEEFVINFCPLFGSIPSLRSMEEKQMVNKQLNDVFQKLLRNDAMAFNYRDLINEGQTSRMSDLYESMEKGFFFRVFLEEELKKLDFETIKRRIPEHKLKVVNDIKAKIAMIKKGVDAAYEVNIRMLNWALVNYAYIKWMQSMGRQ